MTTRILPFLLALAILVPGAAIAESGLVTKASKYSTVDTVNRLEAVLKTSGMTVFARIDHRAEAEKVGLAMPPAQLLIFGNPKGGTPLMVASPTVAIDLPLKALIWEDAGGRVWLSYNTASYLKSRHAVSGKDEAMAALDRALDTMTNKALE
jgi:uncharacterized protein (DUF302 family)